MVGVRGGGLKVESIIHNICFVDRVLRWYVSSAIEFGTVNDEDCAAHVS